jgi:hypothetical protein
VYTCHLCAKEFVTRSLLQRHKIAEHNYTPEKLGWLVGGWNKGIPNSTKGNTKPKPQLKTLWNDKALLEKRKKTRQIHEEQVVKKEKELKDKNYKVFITSNYAKHKRIPDLIAISPDGKIIAVELETIRIYKSSIDTLRKKYTEILLSEGFFDEVLVEGFVIEEEKEK